MIEQDDSQLTLSFVPGVPGQEILEHWPDDVLLAVGRAGRALHGLDVSAAYEIVGARFWCMAISARRTWCLTPQRCIRRLSLTGNSPILETRWRMWRGRSGSLGPTIRSWLTPWARCSRATEAAHPGGSGVPRCSRNADGPLTSYVAGQEPTRHRSRCGSGGWRLRRISGSDVKAASLTLAGFAL